MAGLFLCGQRIYNSRKRWGREENNSTKVSVTLGYTHNLGNFQSLRLDLGVIDSKREEETIDEAFERVYKFVENKLIEKGNEAKEFKSE